MFNTVTLVHGLDSHVYLQWRPPCAMMRALHVESHLLKKRIIMQHLIEKLILFSFYYRNITSMQYQKTLGIYC